MNNSGRDHLFFCISRVAGCCARGFVPVKNIVKIKWQHFLLSLLEMFLFYLVIKYRITHRMTIRWWCFSLEAEVGKFWTCQWSSGLESLLQGDRRDSMLSTLSSCNGIVPSKGQWVVPNWVSDLCPHSPLGTEIMMTQHPPVQEEPQALPVGATRHTVGITAVSKVGELFSFSFAICFISRVEKSETSGWLVPRQFLLEYKFYTVWESAHLDQFPNSSFLPSQLPNGWCHLVTSVKQGQWVDWGQD